MKTQINYIITAKFRNGTKHFIHNAYNKFTSGSLDLEEYDEKAELNFQVTQNGLQDFLTLLENTKPDDEPWLVDDNEDECIVISSIRIKRTETYISNAVTVTVIKRGFEETKNDI